MLFGEGTTRGDVPVKELLDELTSNPAFKILPLTVVIAAEVAALGGSLRDPADGAIGYRLGERRIIESQLVPVVPHRTQEEAAAHS